MKTVDIMETFVSAIENTIFKEWRHEGFIGGWTSDMVNFEIDGKEYVARLYEVPDGKHCSEVGDGDAAD